MLKGSRAVRTGGPFALFVLLCAATLVAALTGATQPLSAARFALTGHWVYNSVLQTAFHIDGGTTNIDARVPVQAEPGSRVVQGDTSGFVVGLARIIEFDLSSLSVQQTITPPADELPVGIEVVGGPYLVYRNAGKVVRLGDPPVTVSVGGAVGDPVVTPDGTMWLHRTGIGLICTLPRGADRVTGCPVTVPGEHAGALTVVGDRPAFVDLFAGLVHTIDGGALGAGVPLGVPVSPNSRAAANDVSGRVAILDPARHSILLADTHNPPAKPVTVALPGGDYDGPVSTGSAVVLVDRQSGTLLTFGADGTRKDSKPLRDKGREPRLSRGEDERVYVEDGDGKQVLVVDKDGSARDVDVPGKPAGPTPTPTPAPEPTAPQPDQRAGQPAEPPRQAGPPAKPKPPPVPASPPGAPAAVSAQAGDGSATVSWRPAADNRAPITSYTVSWEAGTGQTGQTTVGGAARRATINGLTNGVRYVFTVTATNRAGTGPGASAAPVVPAAPVSPAAAPSNLDAAYDVNDRPTRDVTLSWGQPALNGGTLVHYEVTATGLPARQVTGTQTVYPQLRSDTAYTFTVRAVTQAPDGQTLTGQPASRTVQDTPAPPRSITISRGRDGETSNCHAPQCSFINATMTGFAPNTQHRIRLSSDSNNNVQTERWTSNASGGGSYNELNYDVPGQHVWISVETPSGWVPSNKILWERQ